MEYENVVQLILIGSCKAEATHLLAYIYRYKIIKPNIISKLANPYI